jgi:hypothetical protein
MATTRGIDGERGPTIRKAFFMKAFLIACAANLCRTLSVSTMRFLAIPRAGSARLNCRVIGSSTAIRCSRANKGEKRFLRGGLGIFKATPDVYVGPALSAEDLRRFATECVRTIVDFRDPSERGPLGRAEAYGKSLGIVRQHSGSYPTTFRARTRRVTTDPEQGAGRYLLPCQKRARRGHVYRKDRA